MQCNKNKRLREQVQRFRARFAQSVEAALGDVLPKPSLIQPPEESGAYRERIYSPFATLMLFIEQVLGADQSCQAAVARGLSARAALGQSPVSLYTGAYCKARARLPLALPACLAREVGSRLCAQQPAPWRWRGREVKLIVGARDHVVTWTRPQRPAWMDETAHTRIPETLTLREVRAGGRILVTTLIDANSVSKPELVALYECRWHIDLDLRAIKTVMQMDVLRCKTPVMVEKEIAVHLLAYNLVRAVMA